MQTKNDLAEIIKKMNSDVHNNSVNIEKTLSAISAKLESIADDTETADLIRIYIANQKNKLEEIYSKVVTAEDFSNFRKDFADFLQKILDNANALHLNSDSNKEQLIAVVDKIRTLDYNKDFENIADSISEIKTTFNDNSKMNYENIIGYINKLKDNVTSLLANDSNVNKENFDKINTGISDISANIAFLRDFSSRNSVDMLENISNKLNLYAEEIKASLTTNSDINFGQIKNTLEEIQNKIEEFKHNFEEKHDTSIFTISSGFDGVKTSTESILSAVNLLSENLSGSPAVILAGIDKISANIDELKNELINILTDNIGRLVNSVNDLSLKVDAFVENAGIENELSQLKNGIYTLGADVAELINSSVSDLKNSNNSQMSILGNLSENMNDLRAQINDTSESLKSYIFEQNKFEVLQSKLDEFKNIVDNDLQEANAQILTLPENILNIKDTISILQEYIQSFKVSTEENFSQTAAVIDSGIENIIYNLENGNASNENLATLQEKVQNLYDIICSMKENDEPNEIRQLLEEKLEVLRDSLSSTNNAIADTLSNKIEEIIIAFGNIKSEFEKFTDFNFENVVYDIKSQIDTTFEEFNNLINDNMSLHKDSLDRLENVLTETANKMTFIEECVSEKYQNNFDLLNACLESHTSDIKSITAEKFEEIKSDLMLNSENNSKISELVDNLKFEFSQKLTNILESQDGLQTRNEEITRNINLLENTIKKYILAAGQTILDNCNPSHTYEMLGIINQKLDIMASDTSIENLNDRFDEINADNDKIRSSLLDIDSKLDAVSNNSLEFNDKLENISNNTSNLDEKLGTIERSSLELNEKLENFQVNEILNAINTKLDVIALDDGSQDALEEEIENLKEMIFEQRKYFESISDEKSEAIDKYLRDVLLKLDNVDPEKSADDVKASIASSLEEFANELSFDPEDIKGYVQEKTEEINQNLSEVQSQIRQLTNSDDFNYTYTLQDVESDIAKLRLAINNMPAINLDNISNEIKLITTSIENLENSLTPDEVSDLRADFEKLNEDIASISSRTNKLLLNSDESYKTLNDSLSNFNDIIFNLENRLQELDNTDINERIERKIDYLHTMARESANADGIFHRVLTYLGEWIDSTTDNIASISDKVSKIADVRNEINELKNTIPDKDDIIQQVKDILTKNNENIIENVNSSFDTVRTDIPKYYQIVEGIKEVLPNSEEEFEKLRKLIPDNQDIINNLEDKFEKQEERIDRLEMKLDKVLTALEEKDNKVLNRKIEKIEKLLSGFRANIEKLASYVDEE